MTLGVLATLVLAGILGPILALPKRFSVPVAVGEILIGMLLGRTGFDLIPSNDPTISLFSSVGFALVMFTAGSHINLRAFRSVAVVQRVMKILAINGICAIGVGRLIGSFSGIQNWALLSVIVFSSSAAFIVPLVASMKGSADLSVLIAHATMADIISFTILPILMQKHNKLNALVGSLLIVLIAFCLFWMLKKANEKGWILGVHAISKAGHFGLELRISFGILLLVSALAVSIHSSILISGFSLGVVLAAVGVPRRLARQLFALSDGFFAPIFFVLLGASIDVSSTFQNSKTTLLMLLLIGGSIMVHILPVLFRESARFSLASVAQMGIPAAVVTLGLANGALTRGQSGAIMLSALATLLISSQLLKKEEVAE
jgi:Kef-type K+ transport system membrane component KefB